MGRNAQPCIPAEVAVGAGENQKHQQNRLRRQESAADSELLLAFPGLRRANAQLHELNLVGGEQQVGDPQAPTPAQPNRPVTA